MVEVYVLTGGPGAGKTTIRLGLELLGEYTIPESAEDVIKYYKGLGVEEPWELKDYQRRIFELQIQREDNIPDYIKRVFLDRCVIDGLSYTKKGSAEYELILKECEKREYDKIFLIELREELVNNEIRVESLQKAKMIQSRIIEEYENLGYNLIRIKNDYLENRLNQVLENL